MTALPNWLEPMAATLTHERFNGPEWVFERKLDGIRLLAFKDAKGVRLFSRNQLLRNATYPELVEAIGALPVHDAILDGEAIGAGFAAWSARDTPPGYHLFDVLWIDGVDVTSQPLQARRALLTALPLAPPLYLVERVTGERPWERACEQGWEGVVAKLCDAPYEHRRSRFWLKMKCDASQELVVGGFTEPKGSRVGLSALLVGYYQGDDFVFAGKVGTGFDTKELRALRARLDELAIDASPFTKGTGLPRSQVHWARPELVVELAFMEWTGHGKLRHPRFVRVRDDKPARDVVRETPP